MDATGSLAVSVVAPLARGATLRKARQAVAGHESTNMIGRDYEHDARLHAKIHGPDWISRALRKPPTAKQGPKTPC